MFRSLLRKITVPLGRKIPLPAMIRMTTEKVVMPFYHLIDECTPEHIKHLYEVKNQKAFEKDLDYLLRYFRPVSLNDLHRHVIKEKSIEHPSFFLSFDDGLSSFHDVVAPILQRKGIIATCFINPSFVDNRGLMYRYKVSLIIERIQQKIVGKEAMLKISALLGTKNIKSALLQKNQSFINLIDQIAEVVGLDIPQYLETKKPYMTIEQIRSLKKAGFEFGAHSMDHPLFSSIEKEEQVRQVLDSVHWIQENISPERLSFAFPFTDDGVSREAINRIYAELSAPLLMFGTAGLKKTRYNGYFQRISMEIPNSNVRDILAHEYIYYLLKNAVGRA